VPRTAPKPKPEEALRHLPIRDASIVRLDVKANVAGAVAVVSRGSGEDGVSATGIVVTVWLAFAAALLLVASLMRYLVAVDPLAPLVDRRGQLALIGTNMIAVAVVGYLVVAATS
jgi:hypothetical protein